MCSFPWLDMQDVVDIEAKYNKNLACCLLNHVSFKHLRKVFELSLRLGQLELHLE